MSDYATQLDIKIDSDFTPSGFNEILQNIDKVEAALKRMETVANPFKDVINAMKQLNKESAKQTQRSTKTKDQAEKIQEEAEAWKDLAVAKAQASRVSNLLLRSMNTQEDRQAALVAATEKQAAASRALSAAQRQQTQINRQEIATAEQKQQVLDELTKAQKNYDAATREVGSLEKQIRGDLRAFGQAGKAISALETRIESLSVAGKSVPTGMLRLKNNLQEVTGEFRESVPSIQRWLDTIGRVGKQGDLLSGRLSEQRAFRNQGNEILANRRTINRGVEQEDRRAEAAEKKRLDRQDAMHDQWLAMVNKQTVDATRAERQRASKALAAMANAAMIPQSAVNPAMQLFKRMQAQFNAIYAPLKKIGEALAKQILQGLSQGLRNISATIGTFSMSAGAKFATLRSQLDATGKSALNFGRVFGLGMRNANASLERTAAGWSLLMGGQTLANAGQRWLSGFGFNLTDYTAYEKAATRTAISGNTDIEHINDLVFGIQRGSINGQAIQTFGRDAQPVYQFTAEQMAQGAYYLTSALGLDLQGQNEFDTQRRMMAAAEMLTPMLQVAAFTQTDPETMVKGALNVGMQFGYNPRDLAQSDFFAQIAATTGYLANLSTMEVPDIFEAFKMIGPRFHRLSGRDEPGAGLAEAQAAIFFASEVGLKGGNVGRGLDQMLGRLLDPVQKTIDAASAVFPEVTDEASFKDFFFEGDHLKGGFFGFIDKLMDPSLDSKADELIADLFTQNADRAVTGIIQRLRQNPDEWKDVVDALQLAEETGDYTEAMALMERATLQTNDTIFGGLQDMKNAWFEFQVTVIDGIKGPLISTFHLLASGIRAVSDVLQEFPLLSKIVAGFVAFTGVAMVLIGAFLTLAGTIMILQRAFMMTHGALAILFSVFTAIPTVLALGIPILLAVGAAVLALSTLWNANFMGMNEGVSAFSSNMSASLFGVVSSLEPVIIYLNRTGQAFNEFVKGILLGMGDTNNLGAWLQSTFGDVLGMRFMGALDTLRDKLGRFHLYIAKDLFNQRVQNVPLVGQFMQIGESADRLISKMTALRAVQSVLEQIILGFSSGAQTQAVVDIGNYLGIEDLEPKVARVTSLLHEFFGSFINGAVSGFIATMRTVAAGVRESFELIGRSIDWLQDKFKSLTGVELTIQRIGAALGFAFGSIVAVRLVSMLTPLDEIGFTLLKLSTYAAQAGVAMAALGAQALLTAGEFLILQLQAGGWAAALILIGGLVLGVMVAHQDLVGIVNLVVNVIEGLFTAFAITFAVLRPLGEGVLALADAFGQSEKAAEMLGFALGLVAVAGIASMLASILSLFGPFGLMLAGLVRLPVALRTSAFGFGAIGAAILLLGPHFSTLAGWLDTVIGKLDEISGGHGTEIAAGAVIAGPRVKSAGPKAAKAAKIVGLLAIQNPYISIPVATALGVAYAESQIEPMDIYSDDKDFRAFTNQSFLNYQNTPAATNYLSGLQTQMSTMTDAAEIEQLSAQGGNNMLRGWMTQFAIQTGHLPHRDQVKELAANTFGVVDEAYIDQLYATMPTTLRAQQAGAAMNMNHLAPLGSSSDLVPELPGVSQAASAKAEEDANSLMAQINTLLGQYGLTEETDSLLKWLSFVGIDLERGDFTPDLNKLISSQSDDIYKSFMGKDMQEYLDAQKKWDDFQRLVEQVGAKNAKMLYQGMGMDVPRGAPNFVDYLGGMIDEFGQVNDEGKTETEKFIEWSTQAMEAYKQLSSSFPGVMKALNPSDLPGGKGISGPAGLAYIADSFTMPEGVTWADSNEILADIIGKGEIGGMDNLAGEDMHQLLLNDPGFQNFIAETGADPTVVLQNVPHFIFDESAMPTAMGELFTDIIPDIPKELYDSIDHFGTDNGWSDVGVKWSEVAQYGISKGMAGEPWNFVDFLAERFDKTPEEVKAYLESKGWNQDQWEDIGSAQFDATQMWIDSMGGQINLFTPEWYDWFMGATAGGVDRIIEITQEQFDQLPDSVKITISGLGYTFVIDEGDAAREGRKAYRRLMRAFKEAFSNPAGDGTGGPEGQGGIPETYHFLDYYDIEMAGAGGGENGGMGQLPGLPSPTEYASAGTASSAAFMEAFGAGLGVGEETNTEAFDTLGTKFVTQITESFSTAWTETGVTAIDTALTASFTEMTAPVQAAMTLGDSIVGQLSFGILVGLIFSLIPALSALTTSITSTLSTAGGSAFTTGYTIAFNLASGLLSGLGMVQTAAATIANAANGGAGTGPTKGQGFDPGTYASGGWIGEDVAIAGENGAELIVGQKGKYVFNAMLTRSILNRGQSMAAASSWRLAESTPDVPRPAWRYAQSDARGGGTTIILNMYGDVRNDGDIKKIASEVDEILGKRHAHAVRMDPVDMDKF